jgi:hypothetical protein
MKLNQVISIINKYNDDRPGPLREQLLLDAVNQYIDERSHSLEARKKAIQEILTTLATHKKSSNQPDIENLYTPESLGGIHNLPFARVFIGMPNQNSIGQVKEYKASFDLDHANNALAKQMLTLQDKLQAVKPLFMMLFGSSDPTQSSSKWKFNPQTTRLTTESEAYRVLKLNLTANELNVYRLALELPTSTSLQLTDILEKTKELSQLYQRTEHALSQGQKTPIAETQSKLLAFTKAIQQCFSHLPTLRQSPINEGEQDEERISLIGNKNNNNR